MGKLSNLSNKIEMDYINFYAFIDFLEEFTGDNKLTIANFLLTKKDFLNAKVYRIKSYSDCYPNYEILEESTVTNSDNLYDNTTYSHLKIIQELNGLYDDELGYKYSYWKIDEVLNLDFFKNIGLDVDRYHKYLRILEHGKQLALMGHDNVLYPTNNEPYQQETKLKNELINAAKRIVELERQLASIEAGKDNQSDTLANKPKYTTTAITALNHVIAEFWQDWEIGTPAPKQTHIEAWIVENYPTIKPTTATNIDRIARHESLK